MSKNAGCVANSVDPDETPHDAASHLGLHCLLRSVCPNTYGKYDSYTQIKTSLLLLMQLKITNCVRSA